MAPYAYLQQLGNFEKRQKRQDNYNHHHQLHTKQKPFSFWLSCHVSGRSFICAALSALAGQM